MTTKVYVTGVGMITPVGADTKSTWKSLLQGKSGIAPIVAFDTEGFATTIAGESPDFDPTTYVDRKQARRLDRFAQMAVGATAQAMEQAGLDLQDGSVDATRVGSVIGSGIGGILTLSEQWAVLHEKGPDRVNPFLVPMMLADMAPGQVSILYGAKGPNYCTVTACASGGGQHRHRCRHDPQGRDRHRARGRHGGAHLPHRRRRVQCLHGALQAQPRPGRREPSVRRRARRVRHGRGRGRARHRERGEHAAARRDPAGRARGLRSIVGRLPRNPALSQRRRRSAGDGQRARRGRDGAERHQLRERARHQHADERPARDRGR